MLEIENIDVFYGAIQVLWGISLNVNEGEIVTILGSNGAGKTTVLKTIAGLLRPASGKINFFGKSINRKSPHKIVESGVVLVPEGRRLFPKMTVLENLEMGAYTREAKKRRRKTIKEVHDIFPLLKERMTQLAGTLSGGEQQMLAIGRALMSTPKLLLLDEPSFGLAPIMVTKVFEIIKDINQRGVTLLLVEQNVHMALEIAKRGYILENGKVALQDESKKLMNNEHVRKAYLGL